MSIWADRLIEEYTNGKRKLKQYRNHLDKVNPVDCEEAKMINSMLDDMDFAIEWMGTGRQPGIFKGIDRKSIYQRRSLESMDLIPDITSQLDINDRKLNLSNEQKEVLLNIFTSFSSRERQCYILHTAQGMSMQEIADEIGVSKATVQSYIIRARKKVEEKVS